MMQTRKVQQIPKALEKILETAIKKWECQKGDNPECLVNDFSLNELMRQCASSDDARRNCQATCRLYRCHGEYKDNKLKVAITGEFYVRIVAEKEISLKFQQV